MTRNCIISTAFFLTVLSWGLPFMGGTPHAANIDPENSGQHYAYAENIGWISFKPARGPGVTVTDSSISGFAWSELAGWINMDPDNCNDCGVANDGTGNLFGWAWGQLVGWISFSCANTASCDSVYYGVTVDPETGKFSGFAWGENTGWINFNTTPSSNQSVQSDWRAEPGGSSPNPRSGGSSGLCFIDSLQ